MTRVNDSIVVARKRLHMKKQVKRFAFSRVIAKQTEHLWIYTRNWAFDKVFAVAKVNQECPAWHRYGQGRHRFLLSQPGFLVFCTAAINSILFQLSLHSFPNLPKVKCTNKRNYWVNSKRSLACFKLMWCRSTVSVLYTYADYWEKTSCIAFK